MNADVISQHEPIRHRRPIDASAACSQAERFIFEIWSARHFQIASLDGGDLCVWAQRLELRSESDVVASNIAALAAALHLPLTDFEQQLVISPPDESAGQRGRVGFHVSLNGPSADVRRCRALYQDEIRGRWDDVVKTAARVGRAHAQQLEMALEHDAVEPTQSPAHAAPPPECGAASEGEVARQILATELASRLEGKTYDFVLEAADETNKPVHCSGRFAPAQRVPAGSVKRALVGRIETIGKRPPLLKLRAHEVGIDSKDRPWAVSFEYSDRLVADLARLFALPPTAAPVLFEVECFREDVIGGTSERFELRSATPATEREAAKELSHVAAEPAASDAQRG